MSYESVPAYFSLNVNRQLKYIMAKFRFGISEINTHAFRYKPVNENDLLCPVCHLQVENEAHFVLSCPFYNHLRQDFIPEKYVLNCNSFRFNMLMSSQNSHIAKNLCLYLYKAFKLRKIAVS